MSEAAVGPVALGAAQAEAALAQTGDILGGDGVIGQQAGQQQVKNGALGVHHTAGQTADRHTVQIADQEHGTCLLYTSLSITPRGMLSRAASVLRGKTLIVNLPGSPKAVKENLEYILPSLEHGVRIAAGLDGECARK